MSCECETYTCVEAMVNPCSEGTQLDILSDYTGEMTVKVWFGGKMKSYGINVVQAQKIVVPTIAFNENFTHGVRLYGAGSEGVLIGCYWVKTISTSDSEDYPMIPLAASNSAGIGFYVGNGTGTQVFPDLAGKTLASIGMGASDYGPDFWTQTGTSITFTGIGEDLIFSGTIVLNWIN